MLAPNQAWSAGAETLNEVMVHMNFAWQRVTFEADSYLHTGHMA